MYNNIIYINNFYAVELKKKFFLQRYLLNVCEQYLFKILLLLA